jgi:hypothetical protein
VDASGIYVAGLTGGKLPGQQNAGNVDTFVAKLENAPAASPGLPTEGQAGRAQGR